MITTLKKIRYNIIVIILIKEEVYYDVSMIYTQIVDTHHILYNLLFDILSTSSSIRGLNQQSYKFHLIISQQ